MKRFNCQCGGQLFFENHRCLSCGVAVGFDPGRMEMVPISNPSEADYCANWSQHGVCNWVRPKDHDHTLCSACRFNRTIPDLSLPDNLGYWTAIEQAKKRLFFTLMELNLPMRDGWQAPGSGLLFDFLDDERSSPEQYQGSFVSTGFSAGVITLNMLEADDAARATMQNEMLEPSRTLIGHFRHESGHYFWSVVSGDDATKNAFSEVFGDPNEDYAAALARYYAEGPKPDWSSTYISAYATAHPLEDWAETWSHYLHIFDALETAQIHGLVPDGINQLTMVERVRAWQELSIVLNEMNRSAGRSDAYPFTIGGGVIPKLELVDAVIRGLQESPTG